MVEDSSVAGLEYRIEHVHRHVHVELMLAFDGRTESIVKWN